MNKLLSYLVLPPVISDFERSYLARMNWVGLCFFWLHLPVLVSIAWFNDTGALSAVLLASLVLLGPTLAYKTFSNPRHVSACYGFTAMIMGGLLVHFGQGPIQIEMHFYFFVLLALLAVYANPLVVLTAAVTVAAHHLFLWLLLPASVFNYAAPIWVVAVHAAFVVLESAAAIFIARSFFDNVIGLEKIIEQRTTDLHQKNQEMRLVFDNIEQGLLTLSLDGRLGAERSAMVERWFGARSAPSFYALLESASPSTAMAFQLGWAEVIEDIMPLELTLYQLPSQLIVGPRILKLEYKPILQGDKLQQVLVVLTDVTSATERARLEKEQRDLFAILEKLSINKRAVFEFIEESVQLIQTIAINHSQHSESEVKRALHTLKGNSAIFGLQGLADLCHELEGLMQEQERAPREEERQRLVGYWERINVGIKALFGEQSKGVTELKESQLYRILSALFERKPHDEIAEMIAALKTEPIAQRFTRFAEVAKGISQRLEKEMIVEVKADAISLDPTRWSPFWSAFVHVVRNAVDHGLESPQLRLDKGKPAQGKLTLEAHFSGPELVVSISDDGAGIDWDAVARKASSLGYPTNTPEQRTEALFLDGVSSKEEASELSGRGVGLGALRAACEKLGGRISLRSTKDQGTRFDFHFPASAYHTNPHSLLRAA